MARSVPTFPRLVLFDLDGTLVDSAPDIAGALNAALVELGQPPYPLPVVTSYVGDGAAKLVERAAAPRGDVDQALLLDRFKAQYAANICVAHARERLNVEARVESASYESYAKPIGHTEL